MIESRTFEDFTWDYEYYNNSKYLKRTTDIDGRYTDYDYDQLGRLTEIEDQHLAGDNATIETSYDYHYFNDASNSSGYNFVETKVNYVVEHTLFLSQLDRIISLQYMDGLGRPIQTVQKGYSDTDSDVVTAQEYDDVGRLSKVYEPFDGMTDSGNFYSNIPQNQPYTLSGYESSPLNRIVSATPPDWNYPTWTSYGKNDIAIGNNGIGTLFKQTTTDGNNNKIINYTDRKGRNVLTKHSSADNTQATNTYYEYDDKDRLSKVIPPGADASTVNLIYQYLYDGRDRLLQKSLPDQIVGSAKAWHYFKYNDRDLLTFSQDPNMRSTSINRWLHTKYDVYGRPTSTGFVNLNPENGDILLNYSEALTETEYDGQSLVPFLPIYRGKITKTRTKILETTDDWIETITEYDILGRIDKITSNSYVNLSMNSAESVFYEYDFANNIIQNRRLHNAFGVTTEVINRMTFDHSGRQKSTNHRVKRNGVTIANEDLSEIDYTIKDQVKTRRLGKVGNGFLQTCDYEYLANRFLSKMNDPDDLNSDDLFSFELFYNDDPDEVVATNYFNGNISGMAWRVKDKGAKHIQGFQYDYLNRLVNVDHLEDKDLGAGVEDQYNSTYSYDSRGNITELTRNGVYNDGNNWLLQQIDDLSYTYSSNTNRLSVVTDSANPVSDCPLTQSVSNISNSQIITASETIIADGTVDGSNVVVFQAGEAVNLQPGFQINASGIGSFEGGIGSCSSSANGFVQNSNASFQYDENGNMTFDPNKNIVIEYNHLNLPERVIKDGNKIIDFVYDAAGIKLGKIITDDGSLLYNQSYCSGIEY
ncbi:MAG: DUF6443 domain-containing protein [Bacteroidota bacterium]